MQEIMVFYSSKINQQLLSRISAFILIIYRDQRFICFNIKYKKLCVTILFSKFQVYLYLLSLVARLLRYPDNDPKFFLYKKNCAP
jgi:hypothetical protein